METGQGPEWESRKYLVFGVIFMSLLNIGLGQTAIFTLGIPYLDDNVGGRDSPVYFCEFIFLKFKFGCHGDCLKKNQNPSPQQ